MKKVLAGFVVVMFAGLLCTASVSIFHDANVAHQYAGAFNQYPYYTIY